MTPKLKCKAKVESEVSAHMIASHLQAFLSETDYLEPFQSGFHPGFGMEAAMD